MGSLFQRLINLVVSMLSPLLHLSVSFSDFYITLNKNNQKSPSGLIALEMRHKAATPSLRQVGTSCNCYDPLFPAPCVPGINQYPTDCWPYAEWEGSIRSVVHLVEHPVSGSGQPVSLDAQQKRIETKAFHWLWDSEAGCFQKWGSPLVTISGS